MSDSAGEVTSGIRSVLSNPRLYNFLQDVLGGNQARRTLAARYIRAKPGDRVLDMGCGTADILDFLPDVEYLGFDTSPAYIEAARRRFGARGEFRHGAVEQVQPLSLGQFDLVLAMGVLHHLTDGEAATLLGVASQTLRAAGRFISVDGCFEAGQSPIARLLLQMDRGKHVRDKEGYLALARNAFREVNTHIVTDLVRFPYTHLVMDAVAD